MSKIVDGILKDIKSVPEKAKSKLKGGDIKKLLLLNFPYLLFPYVFNKMAWLCHVSTKEAALDKVLDMINRMDRVFSNPLPSFQLQDVLIGIAGEIAIKLAVYPRRKMPKNSGMEWSTVLQGGEMRRILSLMSIQSLRTMCYSQKRKD